MATMHRNHATDAWMVVFPNLHGFQVDRPPEHTKAKVNSLAIGLTGCILQCAPGWLRGMLLGLARGCIEVRIHTEANRCFPPFFQEVNPKHPKEEEVLLKLHPQHETPQPPAMTRRDACSSARWAEAEKEKKRQEEERWILRTSQETSKVWRDGWKLCQQPCG